MKSPIELARAAIERAGITGVDYLIPGPTRVEVPPDAFCKVSLEKLRRRALGCMACPRLVDSRRHVVWGSGPSQAPLMFVGEAPSREEDQDGRPFAGRSGQLLQRVFNEVRIPRSMCRIENVLMCHPEGGRDPARDEMERCQQYLWRKIATVNPLVICTLGKFASMVVLRLRPNTALTTVRGKLFVLDNVPQRELLESETAPSPMRPILAYPTWNPASCFTGRGSAIASRNKIQLTEDLRKVRALVQRQMKLHNEYQDAR